ncbi:MAG: glutathione S-transferase family protein [Candidatus Thioglobus autotrophicus]|nr:glutathione S-transferase family protein [Candidatus Thioglobus autotrophicus]
MSEQPKLELIYFIVRALAESPQMMMRYAGVEYRYEMAWDYYGKPWSEAKLEVAFGQLPVLVVNDTVHIWQSGAIVRYLAKLTGTMPKEPLLAARVDAVFEQTQELFASLNPTVNIRIGEEHLKFKEMFLSSFPGILKNFARQLEHSDEGPYFFGSKPYYCDFSAYHYFSLATILQRDILNAYPSVMDFMVEVENLSGVKEYLASRPEIIDVGTAPKLIIDGIAKPTGTKPS